MYVNVSVFDADATGHARTTGIVVGFMYTGQSLLLLILNEIEKNKRAELYLINKMTLIKRS